MLAHTFVYVCMHVCVVFQNDTSTFFYNNYSVAHNGQLTSLLDYLSYKFQVKS